MKTQLDENRRLGLKGIAEIIGKWIGEQDKPHVIAEMQNVKQIVEEKHEKNKDCRNFNYQKSKL